MLSIKTGIFSSLLKESIIVPIPKVSRPKVLADFRLIYPLPTVDKMIGTVEFHQLRNYFEENQLLYD